MRYPKQGKNEMTYAANIKKPKQTADYMCYKYYLEKEKKNMIRKALFLSCMKCETYDWLWMPAISQINNKSKLK